ncbi:hypothetical protein MNBD_GAMMA26-1783 [hydrothermal vent metagenome]|uniref:ResB-like domain-containing protein n=1 Tax=hydrothermal vent metagenome TaxID=652676 RepID=A0A3B1BK22_9ZZZZ
MLEFKALGRALASHNLALVLISLLALAVVLGGTLPQHSRLASEDLLALRNQWPLFSAWMDYLGLSAVFNSNWFMALNLALLVNIIAGTVLSLQRRYKLFYGQVQPSHQLHGIGALPDFPLPLLEKGCAADLPVMTSKVRGAAGLLGLPLFHAGIAVIVAGGIWSSWVGFSAHIELAEGELYSGQQDKLVVERSGSVSPEFGALLRLDRAQVEIKDGKYLQDLNAHFSFRRGRGEPVERAVTVSNHPLALAGYRIFLDNTMGYSAVLERSLPDGRSGPFFINFPVLRSEWNNPPPLTHRTLIELHDTSLHYHMTLEVGESPTLHLVVRQANSVVFDGKLVPGAGADLGAYRIVFLGTAPWLGLLLTRDQAMSLVFAGFLLVLGGFLLHLLVRFRRVEVVKNHTGWEVRAWVIRNDLWFETQWSGWQKLVQSSAP